MSITDPEGMRTRIVALCNVFRRRILEHSHEVDADAFEVVIASLLLNLSLAKELGMEQEKYIEFCKEIVASHYAGIKITPNEKNKNFS